MHSIVPRGTLQSVRQLDLPWAVLIPLKVTNGCLNFIPVELRQHVTNIGRKSCKPMGMHGLADTIMLHCSCCIVAAEMGRKQRWSACLAELIQGISLSSISCSSRFPWTRPVSMHAVCTGPQSALWLFPPFLVPVVPEVLAVTGKNIYSCPLRNPLQRQRTVQPSGLPLSR